LSRKISGHLKKNLNSPPCHVSFGSSSASGGISEIVQFQYKSKAWASFLKEKP
jgi:hypothetical protein